MTVQGERAMDRVGVGIIGSGFVAGLHAEALAAVPFAEVRGVASRSLAGATGFAERFGIPAAYEGHADLLARDDIDVVTLCAPNDLHSAIALDAARAGKHVICEKPLCRTLAEADAMIAACRDAGVLLMYAEELCFAPKYVRLKQLVDEGALGRVTLVKQSEKHDGPHAPWFFNAARSGGGVALDMGCHAIEFFRWMLGRPAVRSVYADMATHVHGDRTEADDSAVLLVNFEGGALGMAEESWTKKGGMDDRAEVHGTEGVCYANLLQGSSLLTYSEAGYGYAVEKAASTRGWSFTMFEELHNYGFPQEMRHFIECVRDGAEPLETGEDGRAVLEVVLAAYASAREGRRVEWPYAAPRDRTPHEVWCG
jgi:myo-inositol 2-dehydrogenase / D-chiro-inositol 1-dehydrogenase